MLDDMKGMKMSAKNILKQLLREKVSNAQLCAKWQKRKGPKAAELRSFLGWSPKRYRKTLVELTKVVETDMCARKWDTIEFSHVPSLAMSRYRKAFERHTPAFAAFTQKLASGDKSVKINAGAVYPYDVIKQYIPTGGYYYGVRKPSLTERQAIVAQWEALPNFVGDASILPMVDVSGSMTSKAGGYQSKTDLTCLQVAVSLGLYLADKNKGAFKDTFLTFSGKPELLHLKGDIIDKIDQMSSSQWQMNTDFVLALKKILKTAIDGNVAREDMPKILLVLSDMQFDAADRHGNTATDEVRRLYNEAGYDVPNIVYWNLNAYDNVPVKYDTRGTALVSGFSPTIVKAVLATDLDNMTPEAVMLKAIMVPRYDLVESE